MSAITDAQPGDIYAAPDGKLWRIKEVVTEPTVEAEAVEGYLDDPNVRQLNIQMHAGMGQAFVGNPPSARIVKSIQRAFTNAPVWDGWTLVWRRPAP